MDLALAVLGQDMVQPAPLLAIGERKALRELIELLRRLVAEVLGVLVTHDFSEETVPHPAEEMLVSAPHGRIEFLNPGR